LLIYWLRELTNAIKALQQAKIFFKKALLIANLLVSASKLVAAIKAAFFW
jgi:hypothetical protein